LTSDTAEIIIAKQRNGPTGIIKLAYLSRFTAFDNLEMRGTWRRMIGQPSS
jgi:replicative DNA helicase